MKKENGITLIALVITIIVLLILAGVSIAMLTGDNGILTKSNEAKTASTEGEKLEAVKLAIAEIVANKLSDTTSKAGTEVINGDITVENIKAIITRDNPNLDLNSLNLTSGTDDTITFTTGTNNYTLNTETGKIDKTNS